ncbi:MAG: S41 family peptidase [Roseburia sp.]|nr:S41 family peptidase [Roseburia sp.]
MAKKRSISAVLVPLALSLGVVGGIFLGKYEAVRKLTPEQEKLQTILGLIKNQYVDEIDVDSLMEQTIPELLASLDPHSAYIPKSELTQTNEELEGAFGGIGVSFQILSDSVKVIDIIPGGPAEMVGLQPGDIILEAGGVKLSGNDVTNETVFKNLRGKEGTIVKLLVKRKEKSKSLQFNITRDKIPEHSVDAHYMLDNSIGYIRVSKFARTTYDEFFSALVNLREKGAQKYVLDLRGNSGGFMDQAIYMANEFLPAGKMIVYTKGRTPENETMAISDGNGHFQNAEITVLTNEFSASASEIFAGAIQDNDRGLVIGRRSFGKGLVQNPIILPDSSAIRLTVARYYTPTGRSIQKEYTRGKDGKYELDILDRYKHGEFYSSDSIKLDKSKVFKTENGRTVYGGGGIMPDIFVPEDTLGYTSYYLEALNRGLIQRFSEKFADSYRVHMKNNKSLDELMRILPRDNTLLTNFVSYAAQEGLPARWFYINKSKDLLTNQLKAVIARDLVGFDAYIEILNRNDNTVNTAVKKLKDGASPVNITVSKDNKKETTE